MIPILLDKNKTLAELVSSKTGGIGDITGAYDGVAVEEANGLKEITFKLPISSPRYSQITVGSYIKAKVDDLHVPQIYEVYKITKPMKGIVTVKAQHISYILGKATVMPFETTGITMVTVKMIQNLVGTFPFTFDSDIVNSASAFKIDKPMSFRNVIGGWKGSILDVFGGELDWDNINVHLYAHRGTDRGVTIEYGKNLVDLTQEESNANVYDAVIGYAIKDETTYVGDIQKITTTNSPRTLNVDFSSAFDYDETPTVAKLNQLALAYAQNNNIGIPKINLRVAFEPLERFSEYEDITLLEQTGLFDTVHVTFPKLGVDATAKVIRTEYDFINEKPISIELGNAKTNLLGLVDEQIENQISGIDIDVDTSEIEETIGFLDSYVDEMTDVITNSLGLFATKVEKSGGGYQMYLHNRPNLADSQFQWTMNAGGFAVSQDGGDTWSAGIDPNGNAVFNSLAANTVNALKIYGSYIQGSEIVFGDPSNANAKYITAKPYSESGVAQGVSFDGSGTVRFRPQTEFLVQNIDANENVFNYFDIRHQSNQNRIRLYNYKFDDTTLEANSLSMISNTVNNVFTLANKNKNLTENPSSNTITLASYTAQNAMFLTNYKYDLATSTRANSITLSHTNTYTQANVSNYNFNGDYYGNYLIMNSNATQNYSSLWNGNYNAENKVANQLSLSSYSTTGNSVLLKNCDSNGGTINELEMKSDGTTLLHSTSTITLKGDGRIDINSSGSQDLRLISADDIHINPTGFIEVNGIYIYFSGGYVRYTTDRNTAEANKGY